MERKIDIVIPYVDNTDRVWRKAYYDYCKYHNLQNKIVDLHTERYEDIGLINYQLKLINKHMPWVNRIFLLLMNREQAPRNLPNNVVIIYHAQFIPQKFLPTFNSCTIEMFLWNIKDLGEYFIYANDDMLPFRDLSEDDFFTRDNHVKINWWQEDIRELRTVFRQQCINSYQNVMFRLGRKFDSNVYIRPEHSMTPMIKSHCVETYKLLEDVIIRHIRAFRTTYQFNQYIYPIFEKVVYGTYDTTIDFLYTQLGEEIDLNYQIVCINLVPKKQEKKLLELLEKAICE